MLKLLVAPFILYTLFGATHSYGQDQRPSMGLLFHPEENSSIQYSCQASGKEMICDFTQTFVRPQVAPEQMATKSKELYESIINENISLKDCDEFSAISTKLCRQLWNSQTYFHASLENHLSRCSNGYLCPSYWLIQVPVHVLVLLNRKRNAGIFLSYE